MVNKNETDQLIEKAIEARQHGYAPYSRFLVGAAVLTDRGIFTGCNVETFSSSGTLCAERVALFKAVSEGARHLISIAIVADTTVPCPPCGFCRQVMAEFGRSCTVAMSNLAGERKTMSLRELLPDPFISTTLRTSHDRECTDLC